MHLARNESFEWVAKSLFCDQQLSETENKQN